MEKEKTLKNYFCFKDSVLGIRVPKIQIFLLLIAITFFYSCKGISDFYEEWLTPDLVTEDCYLKDGEEPSVYHSTDPSSDTYYLQSNYYWILGVSMFSGSDPNIDSHVKALCLEKRAPIGLYSRKYTNTKKGFVDIGGYSSSYSIDEYNYIVYLFVPMPAILVLYSSRIGLMCSDLNSSKQQDLHRSTGAVVTLVYEKSPAYYANLLRGDVIIAVNGQAVLNKDFLTAVLDVCSSDDNVEITFIRDGIEQKTTLQPLF